MSDTITTWHQFTSLLDNPDLPDDVKVHLIESAGGTQDGYGGGYVVNDLTGFSQDQFDELKKKYNVSTDQINDYAGAGGESFDDVVSDARQSAAHIKDHDEKIKTGKDKLADIRTSAGVGNSNEIMDQALPALAHFSDFLPLYAKVGAAFRSGDSEQAVQDMQLVYQRFDEQRDIPFDKFTDESTRLAKAADAARDADGDMGTALSGLFEHWTGDAGKGAQATYSTFDKDTNDNVVAHLKGVSDAVRTAQAAVAKAVVKKASNIMDILHVGDPNYSNGMLAGKSMAEWSVTIDIANGSEDGQTLRQAAEAWGVHIDEDNCSGSLTSATKETIRKKAQQVTGDILVKNVSDDWSDYMKLCDDTKHAVNKLWATLTDTIKDLPDQPYAPKQADKGKSSPKTTRARTTRTRTTRARTAGTRRTHRPTRTPRTARTVPMATETRHPHLVASHRLVGSLRLAGSPRLAGNRRLVASHRLVGSPRLAGNRRLAASLHLVASHRLAGSLRLAGNRRRRLVGSRRLACRRSVPTSRYRRATIRPTRTRDRAPRTPSRPARRAHPPPRHRRVRHHRLRHRRTGRHRARRRPRRT